MSFEENPCLYFSKGKVKASTLSLSVLVFIEMFNAFNALSENGSLFQIPPWVNPWLILAVIGSVVLHSFIVYIPIFNQIFGTTPLSMHDWLLILAFALPVTIIDEVLKVFGRLYNSNELNKRMLKEKND